jgi:hypothetical protein
MPSRPIPSHPVPSRSRCRYIYHRALACVSAGGLVPSLYYCTHMCGLVAGAGEPQKLFQLLIDMWNGLLAGAFGLSCLFEASFLI